MPCTVGGRRNCDSERVTFTAPLRTSAPSSNSACTISSMKNGLPLGALGDQSLEWVEFDAFAEQRRQHCRAVFAAQRVEPELRVVTLVAPIHGGTRGGS